jgi:hypothetical protein
LPGDELRTNRIGISEQHLGDGTTPILTRGPSSMTRPTHGCAPLLADIEIRSQARNQGSKGGFVQATLWAFFVCRIASNEFAQLFFYSNENGFETKYPYGHFIIKLTISKG